MKKKRRWISAIVLFLSAAPFAWAGWVVLSAEKRFLARDAADGVGSEFVNALTAHKYEAAHALLTATQQRMLSAGAIQKAEEQAEKKYGKPTRRGAIDEYAVDKNLESARFLYDNTFQSNQRLFLVALVCTDGKWQVTRYQYDYNPA